MHRVNIYNISLNNSHFSLRDAREYRIYLFKFITKYPIFTVNFKTLINEL